MSDNFRNGQKKGLKMPPVEELVNFPVFHSCKERYRAGGEGGPLGVGRCSYSIYKDVLVNPTVQSVNLESFVGKLMACMWALNNKQFFF